MTLATSPLAIRRERTLADLAEAALAGVLPPTARQLFGPDRQDDDHS
jgi:hypothetical protein